MTEEEANARPSAEWSPETPPAEAQAASDTPLATEAAPSDASAADGDGIAALERRVAELERELAKERDAATDYMNRWQHAQADFANYKRRAQQDQEQLQRAFAAEAARVILPAVDSFERAFATLPESLAGFTWIDGVALIQLQLQHTLDAAGVRPLAVAPGHAFDPARHEAIGEIETADHPASSVAAVVQRGYEIAGAVLRPALVQLARAPQPDAPVSAPTDNPTDNPLEAPAAATPSEAP
ncbi:MAG TPA: nucleotide exchange factor GrpE [Ktedonobacterales bacterium]|jgi:molecular chaperone GrpE|nr:nucleotide exchange factor GrpE [Ktedonobacterales bacterium]